MAPALTRPLGGRVAVVTGGARGIGSGIALRLARDGAHCVLTYRRSAELAAQVVKEIEREGVKGLALPLELAQPPQVPPLFERVGEAFGRVGILVAHAAATAFPPLLGQKEYNIPRPFAISAHSSTPAPQAALPLTRGRPGRLGAEGGGGGVGDQDVH